MLPSVAKEILILGLPLQTLIKSCSTLTSITSWRESCKVHDLIFRRVQMSDVSLDMQRFQIPYNLKKIPEVQEYLHGAFENAKHHGDLQDLYRRRFVSALLYLCLPTNPLNSLLVEPKQPADTPPGPPANDMRQLFSWATRSQPQQPPAQPIPV